MQHLFVLKRIRGLSVVIFFLYLKEVFKIMALVQWFLLLISLIIANLL